MTDRPIIFSGPMVRALLAGTKTQTRRVLKPQPLTVGDQFGFRQGARNDELPYQPGNRLYVREAFRLRQDQDSKPPSQDWWKSGAWYHADDPTLEPSGCGGGAGKLRPSIHMPRWASRITLVVTDVKVERVQDISGDDCIAEGIWPREERKLGRSGEAIEAFRDLWDPINAKRGYGWDVNPWVAAISFTVHQGNIDSLERAA